MLCRLIFFFFFKQKTAYEMRISDWSSDVCSSDLDRRFEGESTGLQPLDQTALRRAGTAQSEEDRYADRNLAEHATRFGIIARLLAYLPQEMGDRKSVV